MPPTRSSSEDRGAWVLVGLITAAALIYLTYTFRHVLVPFVFSFALAYLANPLINLAEARGLRRDHMVIVLYTVIAVTISISANYLIPRMTKELSLLQNQAPVYYSKSKEFLEVLQKTAAKKLPFGQTAIEHMSLRMYTPVLEHVERLPTYLMGLVPFLSLIFLVPFISFFMLMDSSSLLRSAIQSCPSRYVEKALHLFSEIDSSLGGYVRGMMMEAVGVGILSFAGLFFLGVDYALAIAALSGIFNFVPYVGAVLGAAIGGLVAWFQFWDPLQVLKVFVLFLCIRIADDIVLQPIISRRSVHLHPLFYLLALMIGGQAFGFAGLLFGVPAACVLKALVQVSWDWYSSEARLTLPEGQGAARIPYI